MIECKKIKWYKRIGLFFACFVVLAIPFLTLASDFVSDNSSVTYADTNTDYFTGSGVDFTHYINQHYRDTFLKVNYLNFNYEYGSYYFEYLFRLNTPIEYNTRYSYYTVKNTNSATFTSETQNGIYNSYTISGSSNQLIASYNLYAYEYYVNSSGVWAGNGWIDETYSRLHMQVTYSAGNSSSGSIFGSVVGVKYGAVLGVDESTLRSLLISDNIYVDSSSLSNSSDSLFVIQLFDENNCGVNFVIESTLQYSNDYWEHLWEDYGGLFPQIRTYYLSNNSSSQYQQGYNDGQSAGDTIGYNRGYTDGYGSGQTAGYNTGFTAGIESANEYSFLGLIGAVVDAPIKAFNGLLNFNILGFNMRDFYLGLFSVCIIVLIVRLVLIK